MHLSDAQVDIIHREIRRNGILLNDLRDDLVDHICCLVEERMDELSFDAAKKEVLDSFGSFREIEMNTRKALREAGFAAQVYKLIDYFFTSLYIALGIFAFGLPIFLFLNTEDNLLPLLFSPTIIFGYIVCFTRIDYRRFAMIPFA